MPSPSSFPPLSHLLPHKAPMLLLDEVCAREGERISCRASIQPDSMFVENGKVPALVAIEYMAQCAGVFYGLKAVEDGKRFIGGYLMTAKRVVLHTEAFRVGQDLLVHANLEWGQPDEPAGQFECRIESAGECLAEASLSVYQWARP